jgi:hypothetical protein
LRSLLRAKNEGDGDEEKDSQPVRGDHGVDDTSGRGSGKLLLRF